MPRSWARILPAARFAGKLDVIPLVAEVRDYRGEWFAGDLRRGISGPLVMTPSVIVYAGLAELAPESGLYAALGAMLAYSPARGM